MEKTGLHQFVVFWISQSVSQLGSAMTSFAITIWIYKETNSAMAVSMVQFCTYFSMVIASLFSGTFIDKYNKKKIMLWSDTISVISTCLLWILISFEKMQLWHIYLINIVSGFMNAFQIPTTAVVVGLIVPEEQYSRASGMNSFSSSLIEIVNPMLATFLTSFFGISSVIIFDLISFLVATSFLVLFIKIPQKEISKNNTSNFIDDFLIGINFLKEKKGIFNLIISIALLNFFSSITYENILSPMILARTGGDEIILGVVSGILGLGGIIGGLIVSLKTLKGNRVKIIYLCTGISFLFGDFIMGIGNNVYAWSIAALAASIPIPFIIAQQNSILYQYIPQSIQGRIFAVKNVLQYCTIPVGLIIGGIFADYVFEPLMQEGTCHILNCILGQGKGSGMALMFIITSILGFISSILGYTNKEIRSLE